MFCAGPTSPGKMDPKDVEQNMKMLKSGVYAAAMRNFDRHFPPGTILAPLVALQRNWPNMSRDEETTNYRHYFEEVAASPSGTNQLVPRKVWGSSDTLRMACYLLNLPIFVLANESSPKKLTYTVYKPVEIKRSGGIFETAIAAIVSGREWISGVQASAHQAQSTGSRAPVVLFYDNHHYASLLFRRPTTTVKGKAKSTLSAFRKHKADGGRGTESKEQEDDDFPPVFDGDDVSDVSNTEDDNNTNELWNAAAYDGSTQEILDEMFKPQAAHNVQLQLWDIIKHGRERKLELVAFMLEGHEALSRKFMESWPVWTWRTSDRSQIGSRSMAFLRQYLRIGSERQCSGSVKIRRTKLKPQQTQKQRGLQWNILQICNREP